MDWARISLSLTLELRAVAIVHLAEHYSALERKDLNYSHSLGVADFIIKQGSQNQSLERVVLTTATTVALGQAYYRRNRFIDYWSDSAACLGPIPGHRIN